MGRLRPRRLLRHHRLLYHNFWSYPHFWKAGSEGAPHIWDFFKNFAIVGGCIFIMLDSAMAREVELVVDPAPAPAQGAGAIEPTSAKGDL